MVVCWIGKELTGNVPLMSAHDILTVEQVVLSAQFLAWGDRVVRDFAIRARGYIHYTIDAMSDSLRARVVAWLQIEVPNLSNDSAMPTATQVRGKSG